MIRFFRSSYLIQYAVICVTGILLWARALFDPPAMPPPDGFVPFYGVLYQFFSLNPSLASLTGMLLAILSAVVLNILISNSEIIPRNSSLAGFIFIILESYYPGFLTLSPLVISILLLLVILNRLFASYQVQEPLELIYSAGCLVAIGSMFYFPFLLFYGFILISFIFFRTVNWQEWICSLLGIFTPFLFLGVYYFWSDQFMINANQFLHSFSFAPGRSLFENPLFMIYSSLIVLFAFISGTYLIRHRVEKTLEIRRKSMLLNWSLLFTLLTLPFSSGLSGYHHLLAFAAISTWITGYLFMIKKYFWQELILILFFILILANNLIFVKP